MFVICAEDCKKAINRFITYNKEGCSDAVINELIRITTSIDYSRELSTRSRRAAIVCKRCGMKVIADDKCWVVGYHEAIKSN